MKTTRSLEDHFLWKTLLYDSVTKLWCTYCVRHLMNTRNILVSQTRESVSLFATTTRVVLYNYRLYSVAADHKKLKFRPSLAGFLSVATEPPFS